MLRADAWTAPAMRMCERLAEAIESRYQVKIIEMNPARCRYLSDTLDSTIILQGSASDRDLLVEENINEADVFLALTNDQPEDRT